MTIVIDEAADLRQVLESLQADFQSLNYQPSLDEFGNVLAEQHDEFFYRSRGPDGVDWPEWYWRDPEAANEHLTLFASGRLRRSLTQRTDADHIETLAAREMSFGTGVEYSVLHNEGAQIRTAIGLVGRNGGYLPEGTLINLPKREHVGMTADNTTDLTERVADAAVAGIKE